MLATAETLLVKNTDTPVDLRSFPRAEMRLVHLSTRMMAKVRLEPEWNWSTDMRSSEETQECRKLHIGYALSGCFAVSMHDGSTMDVTPNDAFCIPPGHNAWVVGNEPCTFLDFGDQRIITGEIFPPAPLNKQNFHSPHEVRKTEKNEADVIRLGRWTILKLFYEAGWDWDQHMKPKVCTKSCPIPHTMYVLSGCMHVIMDDGAEADLKTGDIVICPPGHRAWSVGNEPFIAIDFGGV